MDDDGVFPRLGAENLVNGCAVAHIGGVELEVGFCLLDDLRQVDTDDAAAAWTERRDDALRQMTQRTRDNVVCTHDRFLLIVHIRSIDRAFRF